MKLRPAHPEKFCSIVHPTKPAGAGRNPLVLPQGEQIRTFRIGKNILEVRMAKFVTLLVEDDALQREMMAVVLQREGFEVIECATAEAAEVIVATAGRELRALIADHDLSGAMSGVELADYARSSHPRMNIIITSGSQLNCIPIDAKFLRKPFTPAALLNALRAEHDWSNR
jgi:DNA-binding NtrC family response regulator